MQIKYELTQQKEQELFLAGQEHDETRGVEFALTDLTIEARQAWATMFGRTQTHVELRKYAIRDGIIYKDGSVDDDHPRLSRGEWFEQPDFITPQNVSEVIMQLYQQFIEKKTELDAYMPKWEAALDTYQQRKAKAEADQKAAKEATAKAEAEAEAKIAALPWVKQLITELAKQTAGEEELKRFCDKFQLPPEIVQKEVISDKPYLRLTIKIPITIDEFSERTLKIFNRGFENISERADEDYWKPAEFSDLSHAIAKILAKIFGGEIQTISNYDRGEAWLNVWTCPDTIEVSSCKLERDDC